MFKDTNHQLVEHKDERKQNARKSTQSCNEKENIENK